MPGRALESVEDYEREAYKKLKPDVRSYIFSSTEGGATYARNLSAFSRYLIRRRVLQGIEEVKTDVSYFGGKINSCLPFFPSCINLTPMYPNALLDIFRISRSYKIPIFISSLSASEKLDVSRLPKLVPKTTPLVWQIYVLRDDFEVSLKEARLAQSWGYSAVAITVDTEKSVKLRNEIAPALFTHKFRSITPSDLRKIRNETSLPLIVKGIMTEEDADTAVECGADGVGVSNHGGRTMDCGEASIEALPKIVKHLTQRKRSSGVEVFFDSGIRRGTDIIKALALGARGCLVGRPYFWGLAVDRKNGATNITRILKEELVRTAALCGVRDLSKVDPKTVVAA
jgi:4-hydroxymandelate oxidase